MMPSEGDVKRNFQQAIARPTAMLSQFRHRYEGSLDGDTHVLLDELELALQPVRDHLNNVHHRREPS